MIARFRVLFIGSVGVILMTMSSCSYSTDQKAAESSVSSAAQGSSKRMTGSAISRIPAPPGPTDRRTTQTAALRRCADGKETVAPVAPADIWQGPVGFGNAKLLDSTRGLEQFYGGYVPHDSGLDFYKLGTIVRQKTVTIVVAKAAEPYLRLVQGNDPQGRMAYTFEGCPGRSATIWVGGFLIKSPMPRCVQLDMYVAGQRGSSRITIPYGAPASSACRK